MKFTFYSDAGHGWLAVPLSEIPYKVKAAISPFSYIRGTTVFLEEDRDLGLFLGELPEEPEIVHRPPARVSFVRRLRPFPAWVNWKDNGRDLAPRRA